MSESRKIEFDFTRDDYLLWAREEMLPEHSPEWARFYRWRRWALPGSIASTCLFVLALATNFQGAVDPGNGLVLALGAGVAYLWWWTVGAFKVTRPSIMAQRLEAAAGTRDALRFQTRQRVAITPTSVEWDSEGQSWQLQWASVDRITVTTDFVRITGTRGANAIIPARAFASPAAMAEFVETARRFHAGCPAGAIQGLRRFLATRDVSCPACRYNLRGVQTDRCPECGAHLSIERLLPSSPPTPAIGPGGSATPDRDRPTD